MKDLRGTEIDGSKPWVRFPNDWMGGVPLYHRAIGFQPDKGGCDSEGWSYLPFLTVPCIKNKHGDMVRQTISGARFVMPGDWTVLPGIACHECSTR